jgi:ATP/maltotriose-dependent transcriptional regulator MalT
MAGDTAAAQAFCAEALPLARRVGVPLIEFLALLFSTNNARAVGDIPAAERCARDALACARAAGDSIGEGAMWMTLAAIACDRADYAAAKRITREALRFARANGDPLVEVWTLITAGRTAVGVGALDEATAALDAALSMVRRQGQPALLVGFIFDILGEVEIASGHLPQAQAWLARSLDARYEGGEPLWIAMTFDRLATLAAGNGQAERALRLAGAGDRLYAKFGARRVPAERQNLERWVAPLRETLGQQTIDDLWAEGSALDLDQAIALGRDDGGSAARGLRATPRGDAASVLTAREREVATCLARGLSNRQIAGQLVITERTVASHIEHILEKMGFASRHQVAAWILEHGLLS